MNESLKITNKTMEGLIFNIQKFSIHDGPGIRTTVFFKGCLLSCKWCANPESQQESIQVTFDESKCLNCRRCIHVCPAGALNEGENHPVFHPEKCKNTLNCINHCPSGALSLEGRTESVEDIVKVCLQDRPFYEESGGGVTISGGEGMAQPEFLEELVRNLKEKNINLTIETTGHVEVEIFQKLAPLFDLLLYDVKHYDPKIHKEGTGQDNELILENLEWALSEDIPVLVRIPVIPYFNDRLKDAEGFVNLFKEIGIDQVQLLPFHQFGEKKYERLRIPYEYQGEKSLHPEDLKEYQQVFLDNGIKCFF